ncbi:PA14 domain-containing protein [Catenovulum agarivorans]|uniref:PA14 domain-containing protein n=1 Tax=Catenovulum agarivorans TaxID=1172192 RepID=UPI0002FFB4BD|nr:PA14 domain-containing protein [Catenovulum agarivorans]
MKIIFDWLATHPARKSLVGLLLLYISSPLIAATPYLMDISGGQIKDMLYDQKGNLYIAVVNDSKGLLTIERQTYQVAKQGISLVKLNHLGEVTQATSYPITVNSQNSLTLSTTSDFVYLSLSTSENNHDFVYKFRNSLPSTYSQILSNSSNYSSGGYIVTTSGDIVQVGNSYQTTTGLEANYQYIQPSIEKRNSAGEKLWEKKTELHVSKYQFKNDRYLENRSDTRFEVPIETQAVVEDSSGKLYTFHGMNQLAHGQQIDGATGAVDYSGYLYSNLVRGWNENHDGFVGNWWNIEDRGWQAFNAVRLCGDTHNHETCMRYPTRPALNKHDDGHYNRVDGVIRLNKSGNYKFTLNHVDDVTRVIVNKAKENAMEVHLNGHQDKVYTLDAGYHYITIEHYDDRGGESARLSITYQHPTDNQLDEVVYRDYFSTGIDSNGIGTWYWPHYLAKSGSAEIKEAGNSYKDKILDSNNNQVLDSFLRSGEVFRPNEYDSGNTGKSLIFKRASDGSIEKGVVFEGEVPVTALYANSKIYVLAKIIVPNPAASGHASVTPVLNTGFKLYALDSNLNKINNTVASIEMQNGAAYNGEVFDLTSDSSGNIYLMATLEQGGAADFKSQDTIKYDGVTTGNRSFFVGKLNPSLQWQWIARPNGFDGQLPQNQKYSGGISVNPNSGEVTVGTYFTNGTLTLLDESGDKVELSAGANDYRSFILAISSSGKWSTRATVNIDSAYGGDLVFPGVGNFNYIKGSTVEVSAPNQYYIDKNGQVLYQVDSSGNFVLDEANQKILVSDPNDTRAVTRYTCTGYDLEDQVVSGQACRYSFTFSSDVSIKFNWKVEHLLDLKTNITTLGEYTLAQPNPQPTIGRHWIEEGEQVTLQVNGAVVDTANNNKRVLLNDIGLKVLDERTSYSPFTNSGSALTLSGSTFATPKADLPTMNKAVFDGDFTIEFWVNPHDNSTLYGNRVLDISASASNNGNFRNNLLVGLNGEGKKPEFYILDSTINSSDPYPRLLATQPLADNEWQHIALTFDRSENTATFYINGQFAGARYDMPLPRSIDRDWSFLGATFWNDSLGGSSYKKNFSIDELRIWREARTQAQIRNNMNQAFTSAQSNLEYYLKFDGSSASLASQFATNTNNATLVGLNTGAKFVSNDVALPLDFTPSDQRQQPLSLSFNAPLQVTYNWQTQYAIDLNTTASKYEDLVRIQTLQSGKVVKLEQNAGKYWVNEYDHVRLLMPAASGLNQLKGWLYGKGLPSGLPESGSLSNLTNSTTINGQTYYYIDINNLSNAVSLAWEMEILTLKATQSIGSSLTLVDILNANLTDPSIGTAVASLKQTLTNNNRLNAAPFNGFVISGNATTYQDMFVWADYEDKLYPVIPGKFSLEWSVNDAVQGTEAQTFRVELTSNWPVASHYSYVIDTPAVWLDRSILDTWAFVKLAYSEVETNNSVVNVDKFLFESASDPVPKTTEVNKKSTLVFTCTDKNLAGNDTASPAIGDIDNEPVCVRVVSLLPQSMTHTTGAAPVGDVLVDSQHNAPHSGYIENNLARYNPNIYMPERLAGPIIPVNKNFITDDPEHLFEVFWYKNYSYDNVFEAVYWPFKKVRYNIRWPEKLNGNDDPQALQRIVVASRIGSDGKNSLRIAEQEMFDPAKFDEIQIYNQPNAALPGYNPNEEHSLIEASFRYQTESPRPKAAFALRTDLNITTADDNYTSHPYTLVQYKDKTLTPAAYRMKVYKVEMEDAETVHSTSSSAADEAFDKQVSQLTSGLIATYYADANFTNAIHRSSVANLDITADQLDSALPNDNVAVRYEGVMLVQESGDHIFTLEHDDRVRVWIDDELLVNDWTDGAQRSKTFNKTLAKNHAYKLKLEYYDASSSTRLSLHWKKPSQTAAVIIPSSVLKSRAVSSQSGFIASYFNNRTLTGSPVAVTRVSNIGFSTGGSIGHGLGNDNFSVRYTGVITPDVTGQYTLVARADDGVRLWLDGALVINSWIDSGPFDRTHSVRLEANRSYNVRLEYYEHGGGAELYFRWIKPSQTAQNLLEGTLISSANLDALAPIDITPGSSTSSETDSQLAYTFAYPMKAGEPVVAPYPINLVQGVQIPDVNWGHQGSSPSQNVYWEDHKGQAWAISGGGTLYSYQWYPMQPSFWWPQNTQLCYNASEPTDFKGRLIATTATSTTCHTVSDGTFIPLSSIQNGEKREVRIAYNTTWPEDLPMLKAGETLTYSGGEAEEDGIADKGLPGVLAFAAGQIVYDDVNKLMGQNSNYSADSRYSARLAQVLEKRAVKWPSTGTAFNQIAEFDLAQGKVIQQRGFYYFAELPANLQSRIYYDPLTKELVMIGFLDGKTLGDDSLTAAPGAIYSLLPNILTSDDVEVIKTLSANNTFKQTVDELYAKSRNPQGFNATEYAIGLEATKNVDGSTSSVFIHSAGLGSGLALMPSSEMLDPNSSAPDISYVTIAENNHKDLGSAPVSLHIVKLVKAHKFRGEIDVLMPPNVFDEKVVLRHTADFGANGLDMVYEWKYRADDGLEVAPPDQAVDSWKPFSLPNNGLGQNQIALQGATAALLADNLFFTRYRHRDCNPANDSSCWSDWAGAANNNPAKNVYKAQLSEGWVKRVIDRVNLFEARISDFYSSDSPATYSSMLQQAGQRYNGAVALNADQDVIENVGLIQLYQTVLDRARALSIDASQPTSTSSVNNALQLAATRLAQLYTLLANEAYVDALDPSIGFTTESSEYGSLAPSIFTFKNQMPSLLQEELSLLRGRAEYGASPAFNRLLWNFTIGDGEVAYALNYNIKDVDSSGFIDEDDARTLYPQGHGDAWGHYTMALRYYYDLMQSPVFKWTPRAEKVLLDGVTVDVDFQDEQRFAEIAAARAKTGRDIVDMTYRASYVEDEDGQWQGYKDRTTERAWGVSEWAQRAATGAYFDWLMANNMLPAKDADYTDSADIRKVDRTTVVDIQQIASEAQSIYALASSSDKGQNPLGIAPDIVPFDIDPVRVDRNYDNPATHFEQVAERAEQALENAFKVYDYANEQKNRIREVADTAQGMLEQAQDQDRDLRNRLIEIFGTPYEGTIGSGKVYEAGYDGPDLYFYQYVDAIDITNEVAPVANSNGKTFDTILTGYFNARTTSLDHISSMDTVNSVVTANSIQVEYPVTAASYGFETPDSWGIRRASGKIQQALAEILIAQANFNQSADVYDDLIEDMEFQISQIYAQKQFEDGVIQVKNTNKNEVKALTDKIADLQIASRVLTETRDFARNVVDNTAESLPKSVGLAVDPSSPARFALYTAWAITDPVLSAASAGLDSAAIDAESEKELKSIEHELEIEKAGYDFETQQQLREVEYSLTTQEPYLRVEMYKNRENLRQAGEKYRTVLAEGLRLLEERETLNKRIAAKAQGERYKDMTFRLGQYDALQKYRAAFDLAARYTYMAARVYDFETNLAESDPASAQHMLTQIVKERALGEKALSGSVSGSGGLSEILSTLKVNFDVLKTQMGFNNPQTESGRFSLRHGLFRIPQDADSTDDDDLWRNTLAKYKVDNLWNVEEFRRFARNFAPESAGAQPGLVIPFSSTIEFGKNFFGWPLSGGDFAYDASNYATKIRSVGVWFDNYNNAALSTTPRVYLIPVGLDVMYVPDSVELDTREWSVVDQVIPVPLPARDSDLNNTAWIPSADGLSGSFDKIRRHSSFRAYHDTGNFNETDMTYSSRLIGRSVWNTKWLLIIPGGTFLANSADGMNTFIYGQKIPGQNTVLRDGNGVSDIKLFFQTYSYSGN